MCGFRFANVLQATSSLSLLQGVLRCILQVYLVRLVANRIDRRGKRLRLLMRPAPRNDFFSRSQFLSRFAGRFSASRARRPVALGRGVVHKFIIFSFLFAACRERPARAADATTCSVHRLGRRQGNVSFLGNRVSLWWQVSQKLQREMLVCETR